MPDHQWLLGIMSDSNTTTTSWRQVFPDGPEGVPEPIPDWESARRAWSWGWYVHIYGLGSVYLLLALYAGLSMLEFRRRLRIQQYILVINWTLLILGLSRALFLFIDAYESTGKLPTPLSRVLYGIAFPCLTSSYSLIQLVFMRITKVNMGSSKLQNYRVLAAIITTHFTIVIVIDVTVAYRNNLKWLLMLCQSFFITWGLILCFGFVYGGFKMTQFTTETQRVLKQLATYQRVKQETGKDGRKHELALHRITRPKLRILEDEGGALTGMSETSADDSSNSLSFYNEAPLIFDDTTLANAYINNTKRTKLTQDKVRSARKGRYRNLTSSVGEEGESDSLPYLSSESDYVTDPSTVVRAEVQLNEVLSRTRGLGLGEEAPPSSSSAIYSAEPQSSDVVTPLMDHAHVKHDHPPPPRVTSLVDPTHVQDHPSPPRLTSLVDSAIIQDHPTPLGITHLTNHTHTRDHPRPLGVTSFADPAHIQDHPAPLGVTPFTDPAITQDHPAPHPHQSVPVSTTLNIASNVRGGCIDLTHAGNKERAEALRRDHQRCDGILGQGRGVGEGEGEGRHPHTPGRGHGGRVFQGRCVVGNDVERDASSVRRDGDDVTSLGNASRDASELRPSYTNPTLDLKDDPFTQRAHLNRDCVIMNGFVHHHSNEGLTHHNNHDPTGCQGNHKSLDDPVQESGYMADTELNSPKNKKRFWKHSGRGRGPLPGEEGEEAAGAGAGSPGHEPYPLRAAEGTVSLYRIRQGRTLHKALRVTYVSTLLGFICAILQLYAMFGVYGVLSRDTHVEPWPWFVYHLFLR